MNAYFTPDFDKLYVKGYQKFNAELEYAKSIPSEKRHILKSIDHDDCIGAKAVQAKLTNAVFGFLKDIDKKDNH